MIGLHTRAWVVAAVAVLAVACAPAAEGCDASSVTLEVTVTDSAMEPSSLSVCRDQDVVLEITSETDGEFHLHGYDDQVPETSLESGTTESLEFTADTAGQFIIELHPSTSEDEIEIGILTVNEP